MGLGTLIYYGSLSKIENMTIADRKGGGGAIPPLKKKPKITKLFYACKLGVGLSVKMIF